MSGALGVVRLRLGLVLVVLVCSVFALRALLLIDATGLWSDELYTVGKSFQPSYAALLAMLRLDTHPPLYYSTVWIWGQLMPASAVTLRLLSWLAYLAGGLLISAQAGALARQHSFARPRLAVAAAALMAFCSPYPVRFAIEGKGYALLVLLVALAWWWRRSPITTGSFCLRPPLCGTAGVVGAGPALLLRLGWCRLWCGWCRLRLT